MRPSLAKLMLVALSLAGMARAQAPAQAPPAPSDAVIDIRDDSAPAAIQTPVEALATDAEAYAERYGVPPTEAFRRLRAQEESVAPTGAIRRRFADRLAGIVIEHVPAYRIVVLLTGEDPVPGDMIVAGGMAIPVVYRIGAPVTGEQILQAIRAHHAEIDMAVGSAAGMGVDPRTGKLAILLKPSQPLGEGAAALADTLRGIAGVPVELRAWDRVDTDLAIEGGSRVVGRNPGDGRYYACTSGFVVTDGVRDGIVTAAHCPDAMSYVDPLLGRAPMEFVSQWGARDQDVQVHVTTAKLTPIFYADTAKTVSRTVTSWRNRVDTRAGDFVCHRGERTGYSCAEVEFVDFAPPGELCAGPCEPSWVAVHGPDCRSGDSGGPVFSQTIAFGIVKGASYGGGGVCGLYYYMSVDYLPPEWRLLH